MSAKDSTSICNVFKDDTSKIIKKLEMQIPSHFQIYSDMYKEYLHVMDDVFGTCILSEKEFIDKMDIDQKLIKNIESCTNYLTSIWISQIDRMTSYLKFSLGSNILNNYNFNTGNKSDDSFTKGLINYCY